ncbi:hypothetical protein FOF46_01470 [Aquimarina algiphila]|uniref:Uncharacterized protein n=1 Tax=Aquimarina algiphila TaxID=2047982 RepID=A0A554VRT6_9FLAO|nr:hypothetical protein FOF46_01470 [Aquimarina algiphila]
MLNEAKAYWSELGDVPVNENDEIDEDFKDFPKGTDKFEIWHYVEEHFNVSIVEDLMYDK